MGSMRVFVPLVFLFLASVVALDLDPDCLTGQKNFEPCMNFYPIGEPIPDTCCNALRVIKEQGSTRRVRQIVCECIMIELAPLLLPPVRPEYIKMFDSYQSRCHVNLPFPLHPAFNCTSLT